MKRLKPYHYPGSLKAPARSDRLSPLPSAKQEAVPAACAELAPLPTARARRVGNRFFKIIKKQEKNTIYKLTTADGFGWRFVATGKSSALLISRFEQVMGLNRKVKTVSAAGKTNKVKKIVVHVLPKETRWRDLPVERAKEISCRVGPFPSPEKTAIQLTRISKVVANVSEMNGGLLVHGALVEWHGIGVILAGPGGVGKTTAVNRLPSPWRAHSDDNTLIVKSPDGAYWAHAWPTWSRYRRGDVNSSWDVQAAVKLGLICMLCQGKDDRIYPLPICQSISELVDVSGQTFFIMANGMNKAAIRRINQMRFGNAVAIAKKLPVCRLDIHLKGKFWKEIEGFLNAPGKPRKMKK